MLKCQRVRRRAGNQFAGDQDKILIDLGKDQHVVCVRSKVYLNNGKQFQFTESRHKLEKFKFVDYAKRHH